jgi:hypothetical protein
MNDPHYEKLEYHPHLHNSDYLELGIFHYELLMAFFGSIGIVLIFILILG